MPATSVAHGDRVERVFYTKNKRGQLQRHVRESYLRDDLELPTIVLCEGGNEGSNIGHCPILIPTVDVMREYLEVLELPTLNRMLMVETGYYECFFNIS